MRLLGSRNLLYTVKINRIELYCWTKERRKKTTRNNNKESLTVTFLYPLTNPTKKEGSLLVFMNDLTLLSWYYPLFTSICLSWPLSSDIQPVTAIIIFFIQTPCRHHDVFKISPSDELVKQNFRTPNFQKAHIANNNSIYISVVATCCLWESLSHER